MKIKILIGKIYNIFIHILSIYIKSCFGCCKTVTFYDIIVIDTTAY